MRAAGQEASVKKPLISLRHRFMLQDADRTLGKVRDTATLLALAGGRLAPMSVLGLLTHAIGLAVGLLSKDINSVVAGWQQVTVPRSLNVTVNRVMLPLLTKSFDSWAHYEVDGQSVLRDSGAAFETRPAMCRDYPYGHTCKWGDACTWTEGRIGPLRRWRETPQGRRLYLTLAPEVK